MARYPETTATAQGRPGHTEIGRRAGKTLAALVALAGLCSGGCKREAQGPQKGDVYAAGHEGDRAMVWKNGQAHYRLTDGKLTASALSVFLYEKDVYAAGWENGPHNRPMATVWKNGKVLYRLSDGSSDAVANAVYVAHDDVYVAGREANAQGVDVAMVWKDGDPIHLSSGQSPAAANGVCVSGGEVYVAGYETISNGKTIASLWIDGMHHPLTDGRFDARAFSVSVFSDDVYVAGHEANAPAPAASDGHHKKNPPHNPVATLWKNEEPIRLTDGKTPAGALSVCATANGVYVAGYINPPPATGPEASTQATLWKDGRLHHTLSVGGALPGLAKSLSVTEEGDIFIAGDDGALATLWKNGAVHGRVNDGKTAASLESVVVAGAPKEGRGK